MQVILIDPLCSKLNVNSKTKMSCVCFVGGQEGALRYSTNAAKFDSLCFAYVYTIDYNCYVSTINIR